MMKKISKEPSGIIKIIFFLVFYILFIFSGPIIRKLGVTPDSMQFTIIIFLVSCGFALLSFLLIKTTKITEKRIKTSLFTNILLVLIAIIVGLLLSGIFETIKEVAKQSLPLIIISILGAISPGVFEEFLLRGLAFKGFYDLLGHKKYRLFKSALFSSVLFGLIHLSNLRYGSLNSVLTQVVYAFAVGLLFSVIRIKFNGLAISIIIHSLIDLSTASTTGPGENSWTSIIIVFAPIAIISAICLVRLDKDYEAAFKHA